MPHLPLAFVATVFVGAAADDIDFHLLEIGEEGEDDGFVPSVAFGLEGIDGIEVFAGLFGFADKAVGAVGAEKVVGAFGAAPNVGAGFDFDFALVLDKGELVLQIPAEGAEEGVEVI